MITYLLICLIGLSSLLYKCESRYDILFFTAMCWAMSVSGAFISAEYFQYYYALCILSNLIITYALRTSEEISDINISLQIIAVGFIYFNLFGLYYFMNYYEPVHYDLACNMAYVLALTAIVVTRSGNVLGSITTSRLGSFFNSRRRSCSLQSRIDPQET